MHRIRELADGAFEFVSNDDFHFEKGGSINPLVLVYETYGRLNRAKDNAVIVHHALSTSSHLAATEKNDERGWWQEMVGPGKYLDTDRYFIICINNLGSCFGSSGPVSPNPRTSKNYGADFPAVTIVDMVRSQKLLIDTLGIKKLHAVLGSSMGAMLSITWMALYPEHANYLIAISSCAQVYPANTANRLVQKEIIRTDPNWNGGDYRCDDELQGFRTARKIGLMTYRNWDQVNDRFANKTGRESIESYLDYNAEKFVNRFDCNSYLALLNAMDTFDLNIGGNEIVDACSLIKAKVLIVSVDSDVLFTPRQQQEMYEVLSEAGVDAYFIEHHSDYGHDAFLVEIDAFGQYIRNFIECTERRVA
ncbi:MAG: homoserine O-acetyltransferase MetX [Planctomycetota bacterium]|jgi:homoserine O-acetyltransferase